MFLGKFQMLGLVALSMELNKSKLALQDPSKLLGILALLGDNDRCLNATIRRTVILSLLQVT